MNQKDFLVEGLAEGLKVSPLSEEQKRACIMAGVAKMFPVGTVLKVHADLYGDEYKIRKRVYGYDWGDECGGRPTLICLPDVTPDRTQEFCFIDPTWEEPTLQVVSKPAA